MGQSYGAGVRTNWLERWARKHRRAAAIPVATVFLLGLVAAAVQPTTSALTVLVQDPGTAAGSSTTLLVGGTTSTSTVAPGPTGANLAQATTTTAPRSASTAPTSGRTPASSAGTTVPASVTTLPVGHVPWLTWYPGDPYPAAWAAIDAARGLPPYPYVVPDVCRAGASPWVVKPSSTTVALGGGTITVTVSNCVAFRSETYFTYTVSSSGPLHVQVRENGNRILMESPVLSCPNGATFAPQPVDMSVSWTSPVWASQPYDQSLGYGITTVTVPVYWDGWGYVPPPIQSSTYWCRQVASGVAQIAVPVVVEPTWRPQEIGGLQRGPVPTLSHTG